MKKLFRLYHTLKYLKPIQIAYRLYYMIRKRWRNLSGFRYNWTPNFPAPRQLKMIPSISNYTSYQAGNFVFLNLEKSFSENIDWNYAAYGKLWTYNLNYFEYLHQATITKEVGLDLIHNYIANIAQAKDGLEPFPISLRIINWVKFLIKHQIQVEEINQSLYAQLKVLLDHLEYHLLGNHLLENGFALFFAGYYFNEPSILEKAKAILIPELEEQILADGAHFELSPMYHQLMLYRLLDCINLINNNQDVMPFKEGASLREKAKLMLGWMEEISFSDRLEMPLLNDSVEGIAPKAAELKAYAKNLELGSMSIKLKDSGYRKFKNEQYEILVDIGEIGPSYIPGHAHSDSLNFILYVKGKAILVDPGISTYEKNQQRTKERSSHMHNTVVLKQQNSSEVWGGFRVGRRANITSLIEKENTISASHNGYRFLNTEHQRSWRFLAQQIEITDIVSGKETTQAKAFFHFHPEEKVKLQDNKIISQFGQISFSSKEPIQLENYTFAEGFNKTQNGIMAIIAFNKKLKTTIEIK